MDTRCSQVLSGVTIFSAVVLMTACSEVPKPLVPDAKSEAAAKEPSGPAQLVTGKTAFWEMYKSAHAWAKDEMPLSLEAKDIPGFKNEDGKAAMWVGHFGSLQRHEARTFTYAIATHEPDIRKGVSVGRAIPWAGPVKQALSFDTTEFKIDSDDAYKTAHAGAKEWLAKHPDKEMTLSLGNASRFPGPVWFFLWGNTKSGYFGYVSATTGKLVKPIS